MTLVGTTPPLSTEKAAVAVTPAAAATPLTAAEREELRAAVNAATRARLEAEREQQRVRNEEARLNRSKIAHREKALSDAALRRRATYMRRYARYLRMLEESGERHARERWTTHMADLTVRLRAAA